MSPSGTKITHSLEDKIVKMAKPSPLLISCRSLSFTLEGVLVYRKNLYSKYLYPFLFDLGSIKHDFSVNMRQCM